MHLKPSARNTNSQYNNAKTPLAVADRKPLSSCQERPRVTYRNLRQMSWPRIIIIYIRNICFNVNDRTILCWLCIVPVELANWRFANLAWSRELESAGEGGLVLQPFQNPWGRWDVLVCRLFGAFSYVRHNFCLQHTDTLIWNTYGNLWELFN